MPKNTAQLIDWLVEKYPVIAASVDTLSTEKGRLLYATAMGKLELIKDLRELQGSAMRKRED